MLNFQASIFIISITLIITRAECKSNLKFSWKRPNGRCVNAAGEIGLNEDHLGECGNLKGRDLSNQQLQNWNFRGANLEGVNFAHSNLQGADLRGADLSHANLFQYAALQDAIYSKETTFSIGKETIDLLGMKSFDWAKLDEELRRSCYELDIPAIEKALEQLANPSTDHNSCLDRAMKGDRPKLVATLVSYGADLNPPGSHTNDNPLKYAIRYLPSKTRKKYIELLIKLGADPNHIYYGVPVWADAVFSGYLEEIELLIQLGGELTLGYFNVLTRTERLEVFEVLFKHGADPNHRNYRGESPLFEYLEQCRVEISSPNDCRWDEISDTIELFKKNGFDLNSRRKDNSTELMNLVRSNFSIPKTVEALILGGADVTLLDEEGNNALFWAAQLQELSGELWEKYLHRFESIVRLLVKGGANISSVNRFNETVTMYLMRKAALSPWGEYSTLKIRNGEKLGVLYSLGVRTDVCSIQHDTLKFFGGLTDAFYVTLAAIDGWKDFMRSYFTSVVDVNVTNDRGQTPLMYAMHSRHALDFVLAANPRIDLVDKLGYNAQIYWFYCIKQESQCLRNVVMDKPKYKQLADVLSEPNFRSPEANRTLLHLLLRRPKEYNYFPSWAVTILLEHGADRNLKDDHGKLPIDYARENDHQDSIKLLLAN